MPRRRDFLKLSSSAGVVGLTGCTEFATNPLADESSGIDTLPVAIDIKYPQPAILDAHHLISVTVSIDEGGLLSSPELHDPTISLEIEGATIERLLPGTFPINAQTTGGGPYRATGTGILTPWDSDMEAVFTASIVPITTDSLPLSITLGGRTEVNGDYYEATITESIDVISPSPNSITNQDLMQTAEHRADVTEGFGTFLSQQATFTDTIQTAMQEALYGISVDGITMLAGDAVGTGVSGVSEIGAYTLELVDAYDAIHEYHVAGELSDKPIDEVDKEEYGLPFISSIMRGGDDLLEVFDWQVQNFGKLGRRELGAAIVLLDALTAAAKEEAVAWQEGNEQRAYELLGEQLFFISGNLAETELDDVHSRFSDHITEEVEELHMDFRVDDFSDILLAPNGGGLIFYLPLLRRYRADHPEYGPDFEYTTRVIEGFLKGEEKRIKDLLALLETENGSGNQQPAEAVEDFYISLFEENYKNAITYLPVDQDPDYEKRDYRTAVEAIDTRSIAIKGINTVSTTHFSLEERSTTGIESYTFAALRDKQIIHTRGSLDEYEYKGRIADEFDVDIQSGIAVSQQGRIATPPITTDVSDRWDDIHLNSPYTQKSTEIWETTEETGSVITTTATVDVSPLQPDTYVLLLWGCSAASSEPENCRWRLPRVFTLPNSNHPDGSFLTVSDITASFLLEVEMEVNYGGDSSTTITGHTITYKLDSDNWYVGGILPQSAVIKSDPEPENLTVMVHLIDNKTAEPIAKGTVLLWPNRMGHGWGPKATDKEGVVTFDNLSEVHSFDSSADLEVAGLQARAAGYSPADRRDLSWRPSDGSLELTVELEAENRDVERSILTVHVVDYDFPEIPSVTVEQHVERHNAKTISERINSYGTVRFSLEDGGEYTVTADGVSETQTITLNGDTEITLSGGS